MIHSQYEFTKGGHLLVASRLICGYSLDFWTKMKNKTIFGNGIPSPFGWSNRFFGRWPFLAIFGDFWLFLVISWLFSLNCAPQCCSKGGFQFNFRCPIRCRAQLDTRTPSRGPKLGSFGIFGAFCYV